MSINKTTIENAIVKGNTSEAIDMLLKLTKAYNTTVYKSVIMLSSRYHSLQKDKIDGIITKEQENLTENRITFSLTKLLPEIDSSWIVGAANQDDKSPQNAKKKKILFLAANPSDTQQLRLGEEVREIEDNLKKSNQRDMFELESKWAVRIPDLQAAISTENANIVHFSGHGSTFGRIIVVGEDENSREIPIEALGNLFKLVNENAKTDKEKIECVVLNACYSEAQAQEIFQHVPYVIGMNDAIPDVVAILFAASFYQALGNGNDYEYAFNYAQIAIQMHNLAADDIPVLLNR